MVAHLWSNPFDERHVPEAHQSIHNLSAQRLETDIHCPIVSLGPEPRS